VSESRAGDDADPPVSAPQQHRHHLRRGARGGGRHTPGRRAQRLELTGGRGVLEAAAGQHQPIDAVVAQRLHLAQQLMGGAVGAT
jgi:hypothetical protein